jgi:hypothetical protein
MPLPMKLFRPDSLLIGSVLPPLFSVGPDPQHQGISLACDMLSPSFSVAQKPVKVRFDPRLDPLGLIVQMLLQRSPAS